MFFSQLFLFDRSFWNWILCSLRQNKGSDSLNIKRIVWNWHEEYSFSLCDHSISTIFGISFGNGYNPQNQSEPLFCLKDHRIQFQKDRSNRNNCEKNIFCLLKKKWEYFIKTQRDQSISFNGERLCSFPWTRISNLILGIIAISKRDAKYRWYAVVA
jgi:hypothetical protein